MKLDNSPTPPVVVPLMIKFNKILTAEVNTPATGPSANPEINTPKSPISTVINGGANGSGNLKIISNALIAPKILILTIV